MNCELTSNEPDLAVRTDEYDSLEDSIQNDENHIKEVEITESSFVEELGVDTTIEQTEEKEENSKRKEGAESRR